MKELYICLPVHSFVTFVKVDVRMLNDGTFCEPSMSTCQSEIVQLLFQLCRSSFHYRPNRILKHIVRRQNVQKVNRQSISGCPKAISIIDPIEY